MSKLKTFALVGGILLGAVALAHAQADAQKAYQEAKTAYQAGRYGEACDLAEKAAQTAPKNAEVFLLLGQARYQLGQVDEAMAAWKQTLALAPKEAFAARMLEVLQAQRAGVDTRITLIETLLDEKLFDSALQEIKKLLTDKAISEAQRAKLLLLQADALLGWGKPLEAERTISDLAVLYPKQANPAQVKLLSGRAKLNLGPESAGEGITILKQLATEQPESLAAAMARYELIVFNLKRNILPEKLELDALKPMLSAPLARQKRLEALQTIASCRIGMALKQAGEIAKKGEMPPAPANLFQRGQTPALPNYLAQTLEAVEQIEKEYPAEPVGRELRLRLAGQLRSLGQSVPWPEEAVTLRGTDYWAMFIAAPVIKSNTDAEAVKQGVDLVQAVISDYAPRNSALWWRTRAAISRWLANDLLSPQQHAWAEAIQRHADLMSGFATFQFDENRKAILQQHLGPWMENHYWAVVDETYTALAGFMQPVERRRTETALVRIWAQRVFDEHERLLKSGFAVPRRLDPLHARAVGRLYILQTDLEPQSPELKEIRDLWLAIIDHYARRLQYDDAARAALEAPHDKPVAAAEEFVAFQSARLQHDRADSDFARLVRQYGMSEKIALTPQYKAALDAWTKFIAEHPASPLAARAVERIFGIAQVFERQQAFAIAADVYADLAKFASAVNVLARSAPNVPSILQRAEFARAAALDSQARKVLQKTLADRKDKSAPPEKPSDEFTAAIAAYTNFLTRYNQSPLVAEAVGRIMAVGVEYAKIDAWGAADAVYADLLDAKLDIRRPERLAFARGLCQLGRAMPDHAREMLTALSLIDAHGAHGYEGGMPAFDLEYAVPAIAAGGRDISKLDVAGKARSFAADAFSSIPASGEALSDAAPASTASAGERLAEAGRDARLLAMIQTQEADRARQVAQLREESLRVVINQPAAPMQQALQTVAPNPPAAPVPPALSDEEIARQDKALSAAYEIFQSIRKDYSLTATAEQARGEIIIMASHWRSLRQWLKAAELTARFLADNPTDAQLPQLHLEIARDRLAWAAKPLDRKATRQELLADVASRFAAARENLSRIIAEFPEQRAIVEDAQWEMAVSYLTEARVIDSVSPTLARGQYVRTAKELAAMADKYPGHPRIGSVGQMLWDIAGELAARGYDEEAIAVWSELMRYDPLHGQAQEAAMRIAQTYQQKLKRPLRAAEVYQELNFIRGGNDQGLQNAMFQIGSELKDQKRWVEALHVLETFADSFPRHPQAGQALTMAGQIHQANEAWADAIAAYRRVIDEFRDGQWVQDAKWSVAECTINLSRWNEAIEAYRAYVAAYPNDGKVAEANRRIEVLKDLARYQTLVDEKGQRKAFDAQFQIAIMVKTQLGNPVKAIIEYRKVAVNWPESYLAAEALYAVGETYLSLNETAKAREALNQIAEKYPQSPRADDALFLVGKSYEDEADRLATVTRAQSLEKAKEAAQRGAYDAVQVQRRMQQDINEKKVASLKAAGKGVSAELMEAANSANYFQFNQANVELFAQKAEQQVESLTAIQLADRQDKINAALRKAVEAYTAASKVPGADKAGDALLQMATIYDQRLKDSQAAMQTWLEIVRQFSGTSVAEDASWKIAQFYERHGKYSEAIDAYQSFLRNYRRSPNAGPAQFAVAENYEHLGQWVNAMDSYSKYIASFPDGPMINKAKEQINWIKTYRL
jgi:TolA-binding protein